MKKTLQIFTFLGALSLVGCSTITPNDKYSQSFIESHVIKGKTTQAEIKSLYGAPDENTKSSNETTWVYYKNTKLNAITHLAGYIPGVNSVLNTTDEASAASSNVNTALGRNSSTQIQGSELYILFDKKGIVSYWNIR